MTDQAILQKGQIKNLCTSILELLNVSEVSAHSGISRQLLIPCTSMNAHSNTIQAMKLGKRDGLIFLCQLMSEWMS